MGHSEADCREILSRIFLFIDGEVAGVDYVAIETHLSDCAPCFRHAEFERAVKVIVARKCSGETAPAHVLEVLRARLREQI